MSGAFDISLQSTAGSLTLSFPGALTVPLEMTPIYRGMQGIQGLKGDAGEPADAADLPDLSIIFDNQLI